MNEDKDWLFDEDELLESIRRFEDMQKKNLQIFFDVHELEAIITYYLDINNKLASVATDYALKLYPESIAIQLKFAHQLIFTGKPNDSLKLLHYIEKVEGSNYEVNILKGTALNLLGKTSEAKAEFDIAVSLSDENKDEVLYNIGISFEDRGQFLIAIDYFKEAYQLNANNISVLYDLAFSYERAGFLKESAFYYDKYLDEDPFSENVWYNLAIVYSLLEDTERAVQAYDYAIAINEEFSSAYFNKGNLLFNADKYSEAIEVYKEFLKLEPQSAEAYSFIGDCYEKLNETENAIKNLNEALIILPEFAEAWHNLANVYLNNSQFEKALTCIHRALDQDKENTGYLFTLASVYYKMKDFKNALKNFKKITDLDPYDEEAWMCSSEILFENSKIDDAIKTLSQALSLNQESSVLNYRIGSFYMLKGNEHQSFKYLENGLRLNFNERQFFFDFVPEATNNPKIKELLNNYM